MEKKNKLDMMNENEIVQEQWKEIENYEGFYVVSNEGNVRGIERSISLNNGKFRVIKSRIIKPNINKEGYYLIRLNKEGSTNTFYLHRLVASHFIENPERLPQVNHLNGKTDNRAVSLEWSSASQNTLHSYKTGLNSHQKGNHFLACGVVDNELGETFETIKEWCNARGISYSTGRNQLSGSNKPTFIDLTKIIKLKKSQENGNIN